MKQTMNQIQLSDNDCMQYIIHVIKNSKTELAKWVTVITEIEELDYGTYETKKQNSVIVDIEGHQKKRNLLPDLKLKLKMKKVLSK